MFVHGFECIDKGVCCVRVCVYSMCSEVGGVLCVWGVCVCVSLLTSCLPFIRHIRMSFLLDSHVLFYISR